MKVVLRSTRRGLRRKMKVMMGEEGRLKAVFEDGEYRVKLGCAMLQ
jgi:hypothetical protein